MFGLCRDPLVVELHKLGFSLVPLADANIRPLELLGRQGKELFRFGELSKLFVAGNAPLPTIESDVTEGVTVSKSGSLDSGLGLSVVLDKWLGGDKAGLKGKLKGSSRFELRLNEVKKDRVNLGELDAYLVSANMALTMPTIGQLLDQDEIYVTVAVLKSPSMQFRSESGRLVDGEVSVPDVGAAPAASAKINLNSKDGSTFLFKADKPVVFAFQAVQLRYDNGMYKALRVERRPGQLMSDIGLATAESAADTGYLADRIGPRFASFAH